MITCPNFQAPHPANTLFCEECGSYMIESRHTTDPLRTGEVRWTGDLLPGLREDDTGTLRTLKIVIVENGRQIALPLNKEVNVGRLDAASGSFPDVDLTADGGLEKGVSRRHVKIFRRGAQVFIEDLGSVNGTYLNRKRLTPYLPNRLKDGDEVQLGKLSLRIDIQ